MILDLAHHGTTMLAGCLEILGVPMVGASYDPERWEDREVVQAMRDEHSFAEYVAERNQHKVWGFKYPGAWLWADMLEKYLIDPIYFAIYKDPVSVAWRRANGISTGVVLNTMNQMQDSVSGISASGLHCYWLSYHRAITDPHSFIAYIVRLARLDTTEEQVLKAADYIKPGGYRPVKDWLS